MAQAAARSEVKSGSSHSDLTPPVRQLHGSRPGGADVAARPMAPAMAPDDVVTSLVETGNEPGAAENRRDILAHIQRTRGNRYAAQVLEAFRAQKSDKGGGAAVESSAPAKTASSSPPPAAALTRPGAVPVIDKPTAAAKAATIPVAATPATALGKPAGGAASPAAAPTAVQPSAASPAAAPAAAGAALAPAAPGAVAGAEASVAAGSAPAAGADGVSTSAAAAQGGPPTAKEGAAPGDGQGQSAAPAAPAAAVAAPTSPAADPAFQAVVGRARAAAHQLGHNNPAKLKAAEAQAAAVGPPNEVASQAAAAQVGKMDAQEPQPFDRAGFKTALVAKITEITPKNLKEADEFKKSGGAASVKGAVTQQVQAGKDTAQGGIKAATTEAPDPNAGQPKPVTPMPPTEAGPPAADVGAAAAAPKPKSEGEVSLQAESKGLDQQMAGAGVNDKQLETSNEPAFQSATQAKGEAQTNAQQAPAAYREREQSVIAGAKADAVAGAGLQTQQMHATRQQQFGLIGSDQLTTQQADKEARAEVAGRLEEIFQGTRTKVEDRLARLDKEVNDTFDHGAEQAKQEFEAYVDDRMTSWKIERYLSTPGGSLLWIKDQFLGLPDEVNAFYAEGRARYVQHMDVVIDQIATTVETGLNEAKHLISAGRSEVQTYVASLPENLKQVGEDAAANIQGKFDSLKQTVDDKGNQLVDQLAQKYVENLGKLDERIGEMKAENRGLVDKAKAQLQGVIDTIIGLKTMLLGILAKASAAIDKIIADPIAFLGNLVAGVKAGLTNFMSNIGTHLKKGLMDWLFGALAGAGLQLPETLDLKGIISIVLQVLGLTYANFRARAVAIVGEPVVKALEEAAEVFKILVTEGIPGLWRFIKEKLSDLKSMVMDAIMDFIRDRVIIAGITWLIGLLNPASAFIKACKAIYDIVMFFVNRGSQIISLVSAIVDSIAAIASGAIGVAATWVENALAKAIPVAIGFLASLLGLGDPSAPVKNTIDKARSPVFAAMDWVIHQAVKLVKAAGKFIGGLFGGKKDKDKKEDKDADPAKAAKIEAGLAAIDREEKALLKDERISREHADAVAVKVKGQHPVFTSIRVKDGGETWNYVYEASPAEEKTGEKKEFVLSEDNKRRHKGYERRQTNLGKTPLGEQDWYEKIGHRPGPNPHGKPGDPNHQRLIDALALLARAEFPDAARYEIRRETSMKGVVAGTTREPDVWVYDRVERKVVKIYEAARTKASAKDVPVDELTKDQYVKRERDKMTEYDELGIPSEFWPVRK
ncbi:MAG: hypothetical protein ABJA98_06510 [Acidobacteriota bacterium]